MNRLISKFIFLLIPLFLLVISFLVVKANAYTNTKYEDDRITNFSLEINKNSIDMPFTSFLAFISSPWQLLPVAIPPFSFSYYIDHFSTNSFYNEIFNLGCEMGDIDEALPGVQDRFVYLDFGRPVYIDGDWKVQIMDGSTFIPLSTVQNEAVKYAGGYWMCSGSDNLSQLTLAIGTSNEDNLSPESPEDYVTYEHGVAWANMIISTANYIDSSIYGNQVRIVTASDMELDFNDPVSTRSWVNGVNDVFFDPYNEILYNILFNIGDAEGCSLSTYTNNIPWDSCGSQNFPEWAADDIWFISDGCQSCEAFPMIYTTDWTNATQWKRLGEYGYETHVVSIQFAGELTQNGACSQRPENQDLCATPSDSFQKLHSTLNSDPRTSQQIHWSSDIRWMPTPTSIP